MSGKYIIFDDKKVKNVISTKTKNYSRQTTSMLIKYQLQKKKPYGINKSIKYFIGYNDEDDDAIRPLCIKLPQMIGYVKCFDSNKTMSFKAIDNKLLKTYTEIWK